MKFKEKFWLLPAVMLYSCLTSVAMYGQYGVASVGDEAEDAYKDSYSADGPEPPPPADINQYVVIALLLAVCLAFVYFYYNRRLQNNNDINL